MSPWRKPKQKSFLDNMDTALLQKILNLTYTKKQIQHRLGIFKEILNLWLFTDNGKTPLAAVIEKYIADNPRLHKDDIEIIHTVMPELEKLIKPENADKQANELLKQLGEGLTHNNVVSIYFGFDYDDQVIADIGKWFKTKMGYNYVLEPSFDGNLIGGCAYSYNGIYRDTSIRARIEQNKQAILESLLRYKR